MRLILGEAKRLLASHAPEDVLEDRINRAIERILLDGKFLGGTDRIALLCEFGDLTLPRGYRTLEGIKLDKNSDGTYRVRTLTNGWFEFLQGKESLADASRQGFGLDAVRSLGDGWPTLHDLPLGGTLTSLPTGADEYVVTVYGRDSEGMPLVATLTNTAPSIANSFIRIERLHKDQTAFVVKVQQIADDSTVTNLAIMEGGEEDTFYRRYRDDSLTNVAQANAIALVKRRHIETTSDQDILPITNVTALGLELDSLQYLAENDISVSDNYHARALAILNSELKDSHSSDEIPMIRFFYPGGAPRLTSHM
jgi:hypothetical protein